MKISSSKYSRTIGTINLIYGAWAFLLSWDVYLVPNILLKFVQTDSFIYSVFIIGMLLGLPFVIQYSKLKFNLDVEGWNTDTPLHREVERRLEILDQVFPAWKYVFNSLGAFIPVSFFLGILFKKDNNVDHLAPLAFIVAIQLVSSFWFLFMDDTVVKLAKYLDEKSEIAEDCLSESDSLDLSSLGL